ncbi:MauE/DoxX family redox-associated membrane protein [Geotalea sp. SG265]|uniref:MauE/DoxX family redox-associated membrane protein n=1 Tax=Geotalea sp. SG265 TaxID=2922867 RepID=UPI001FB00973|nr:MauE/DoxX family redox-associated membrane protein [Geotalea sp. SG265]
MNLMGRHMISIIRVALGTVFVYAGALKVNDIVAFAGNIAAYQLLPYGASYMVAAVFPWLEIACGLLLIIGWRTRAASALVILLNVIFIVALATAIARGLDIDCGCFKQGGGDKTSAWQALLRDLVLFAAAIAVYLKGTPEKQRSA